MVSYYYLDTSMAPFLKRALKNRIINLIPQVCHGCQVVPMPLFAIHICYSRRGVPKS